LRNSKSFERVPPSRQRHFGMTSLSKEKVMARIDHIMTDERKVDYVLKLFHTMYPYSQRKEGTENDLQN
jgi:hypothetical protein